MKTVKDILKIIALALTCLILGIWAYIEIATMDARIETVNEGLKTVNEGLGTYETIMELVNEALNDSRNQK